MSEQVPTLSLEKYQATRERSAFFLPSGTKVEIFLSGIVPLTERDIRHICAMLNAQHEPESHPLPDTEI